MSASSDYPTRSNETWSQVVQGRAAGARGEARQVRPAPGGARGILDRVQALLNAIWPRAMPVLAWEPALTEAHDDGSALVAKPQAACQQEEELMETETKIKESQELELLVIAVLKTIFDPEIPVNIYDLGLIYAIDLDCGGNVKIQMTLTAPGCPVAGSMPGEVARRIETIPGVNSAAVELVWEPAWSQDRLSEEARLTLGLY